MGAGKSSAARSLAAELGVEPLDSDRALEAELGEPIEAFFDREGEAAFRAREEETVLRLLAAGGGGVVALGGGATGSERVREALRAHTVVHLEVEPRRGLAAAQPARAARWRAIAAASSSCTPTARPLYDSVAHAMLPPAGRDVARRALPALLALRDARDGGAARTCAWCGRGRIGRLPGVRGARVARARVLLAARRPPLRGDRRERGAGTTASRPSTPLTIPPGEEPKTLATAETVLRRLAQAGAERGDVLAAVGGGVVGDLAGFCAALYQRGMRVVQVPTTLVAQVDSAYGGKTGVDLPEGKNYAGAYHQPAAVICDPATLDTLPPARSSPPATSRWSRRP